MNKREIFKKAHEMARTFEGNYRVCFIMALKEIFSNLKKGEQKMLVTMNTGSEFHSTFGSKGYVFVVENNAEDFIYKKFKAQSSEWDSDSHCKRSTAVYDLPEGTVLKAFFSGAGKTKGRQTAYFVVDSAAQFTRFESELTAYCGYFVEGNLRQIEKP